MLIMKKWLTISLITLLVGAVMVFLFNYLVTRSTTQYLSGDMEELEDSKVAVVLGTSRYLTNGQKNLYFKYRMDAAAELFAAGKVEYILVSGDNRQKAYNEPVEMKEALMERGIPEDHIVLDYAGFRTLDSMVRANKVFGQEKFIVISQAFHNQRAVYIARNKGLEAYGYNAKDVAVAAGFKTRVREVLARTKMMLDLYVLQTEPHFLGEQENIGS